MRQCGSGKGLQGGQDVAWGRGLVSEGRMEGVVISGIDDSACSSDSDGRACRYKVPPDPSGVLWMDGARRPGTDRCHGLAGTGWNAIGRRGLEIVPIVANTERSGEEGCGGARWVCGDGRGVQVGGTGRQGFGGQGEGAGGGGLHGPPRRVRGAHGGKECDVLALMPGVRICYRVGARWVANRPRPGTEHE